MDINKVKTFYTYLQSQETTQHYLNQCYKQLGTSEAVRLSYQNANTFMYNLEHGHAFYTNGKSGDSLLQPMFYFYGMVHLLKASLIAIRPYYPESTKMLAHGVSSRKRKKKQYSFLKDDVKIQYHGLFPYFSEHLFHVKQLPFEKITMQQLITLIPEVSGLLQLHGDRMLIKVGKLDACQLLFPIHILDKYHTTAHAFIKRIKAHTPPIINTDIGKEMIHVELEHPIRSSFGPFFLHFQDQHIYFPSHREQFTLVSEVMIHYLLLYNLSMLSRYEPQWWGELLTLKPDMEYPLISHFLTITAEKMPYLLGKILLERVIDE